MVNCAMTGGHDDMIYMDGALLIGSLKGFRDDWVRSLRWAFVVWRKGVAGRMRSGNGNVCLK